MGILAFIGAWFARLIGVGAVRAIIWKGILYTLFVTIFPTVLYNLFSSLLTEFIAIASSYGSTGSSVVVHLTGFAGWFAAHMKIPEVFSMIISALCFRVTISFIPFLRSI